MKIKRQTAKDAKKQAEAEAAAARNRAAELQKELEDMKRAVNIDIEAVKKMQQGHLENLMMSEMTHQMS